MFKEQPQSMQQFFRDDHHHSPLGAKFCGRSVSDILKQIIDSSTPQTNIIKTPLYDDNWAHSMVLSINDVFESSSTIEIESPTFPKPVKMTLHLPHQQVQFNFLGVGVGILIGIGPYSGLIEYQIDSSSWEVLNTRDEWAYYSRIAYRTLVTNLPNHLETHTLTLRIPPQNLKDNSTSLKQPPVSKYFIKGHELVLPIAHFVIIKTDLQTIAQK